MKTPSRRHPAAFTLIELMAVITIIVILAGIVVAGLGFVNEKQAREKTKVQIGMLERAIEEVGVGGGGGGCYERGGGRETDQAHGCPPGSIPAGSPRRKSAATIERGDKTLASAKAPARASPVRLC